MRSVIDLLIWIAASVAVAGGVALAAARLIPPYLVHE